MKKIPLVDLQAQLKTIRSDVDNVLNEVISNTAFIGGKFLSDFEKDFAAFCEVEHAIAVSNGTDALFLALTGLGVGPGDEVITVPNTFIATSEAITRTGATIKFVDVDPDTYNMDPAQLEMAITPKTKAILPVHLYGHPADMDAILEIAKKHDVFVIEDAAQAHGARYNGKRIGTFGKSACFSFYPGKNLGAFGDAGAIVTNDAKYAENLIRFRNHGRLTKYEHSIEGYNHRCDSLQAAILAVKLKHLEGWNQARRQHAQQYNHLFEGVSGIRTPREQKHVEAVYHLYVIEVDDREALKSALAEKGIASGIHYPVPLHLQPAYTHLGIQKGAFPVTEHAAERILSLPLYPELTPEQIDFIAASVIEAL